MSVNGDTTGDRGTGSGNVLSDDTKTEKTLQQIHKKNVNQRAGHRG